MKNTHSIRFNLTEPYDISIREMWKKCTLDIFEYDDYRVFLRDAFKELKTISKVFSHRYFAKKAGFASAGFVTLVLNGQRNLSFKTILKFSAGLKMNSSEKEFFEHLVYFTQATKSEDKSIYYKRLSKYKKNSLAKTLESYQYDYWSNWYFPAIRELALLKNFELNALWISRELGGQITVTQAQHALDVLFKLDLLHLNDQGKVLVRDMSISSGSEVASLAIMNFHREMLRKAEKSLDLIQSNLRDISSVTFTLALDQIPELKSAVQEFRRSLLRIAEENNQKHTHVYQINVQMFPLSGRKPS